MFGVMLSTREHRYANRWAWFWLFLLTPLGLLGYLWLEKRPFPPPTAPRPNPLIGGVTGFCYALGLGIVAVLATRALAYFLASAW